MSSPLEKILPVLTITPQRWTSLLSSLSLEQVSRKPAPGEWSAVECLVHILDVEKVFQIRLNAFLAGQNFPAFNPDEEGSAFDSETGPAELAARFKQMRSESLKRLKDVMPQDLDREAVHSALGPVKLRELLNEWAAHDLSHTVQAEEALMQPFIEACGPWHVFFEAHKVKKGA